MIGRASVIKGLIDAEPIRAGGLSGLLERVCFAVVPVLSASGAGISMMTADGTRGVCIASDPVSQHVDDLQFVLGEGPCMEAFEHRRPVLVTDVADTATRWPLYAPAAEQGGVRAVFAFPLQIGAARLGALDVYRDEVGSLSGEALNEALAFAEVALTILLDEQERAGPQRIGAGAEGALGHRVELYQAQGMVQVQLGVGAGEALVRLRAHAYANGRRLGDVARDVVARTLTFERDTP
jgi:hypothetical protein